MREGGREGACMHGMACIVCMGPGALSLEPGKGRSDRM